MDGLGTWIEAPAPPEIAGVWLITHSMISWLASVAMARYVPLMRSEGMPTMTPMKAAIRPPAGSVIQNGRASLVARLAAV